MVNFFLLNDCRQIGMVQAVVCKYILVSGNAGCPKNLQHVQNFYNFVFGRLKWLNLIEGQILLAASWDLLNPQIYWSSNVLVALTLQIRRLDGRNSQFSHSTSGWTVIEGQILLTASWDPLDPQIYWSSNVLVALTLQSRWLDSRNS